MFKLKKGNVIEKLNAMNRKQIYTYGGIALAVVSALFLLASFLGNAEDPSFDGFSSRGYDLATSPFVTDEAEEYLLASKYPDMQEQPSNFLYSQEEKEARQAEDAALDEEEEEEDDDPFHVRSGSSSRDDDHYTGRSSSSRSGSSSRGYKGRGGSGSRQPTQINQMGNAQRAQVSGGGASNAPFGGTRRDSDSRKDNNKEGAKSQTPAQQNQSGRRALAQFSQGASAAAKLKDNKDLNMKRALMGNGNEANPFNEDGSVDLSKVDGAQLDTNAPQNETPDLTSLQDSVKEAGDAAKDKAENNNNGEKEDYLIEFLKSLVDIGKSLGESMLNQWASNWVDGRRDKNIANSMAAGLCGKEGKLSREYTIGGITIPAGTPQADVANIILGTMGGNSGSGGLNNNGCGSGANFNSITGEKC